MTLFLTLFTLLTAAPDTLTLAATYQAAEAHFPRRQAIALQGRIADLKAENLGTRFLPSLSLQGQATYQSHVVAFPFAIPGQSVPAIDNDQYKVALNVNQLVYDGGLTALQRELEVLQRDLANQSVAVEQYALHTHVNTAFFGALALEAQLALLQVLREDLEARRAQAEALERAGAALRGNVDVLAVELIKVGQQEAEARARRRSARAVLAVLTGEVLDEGVVLVPPDYDAALMPGDGGDRPEYAAFALSRAVLAGQARLVERRTRPQVVSFLEAAYGRPPGLDFFTNTFEPFYALGLRVQWPFWDWQQRRREHEVLTLQQQVVDTQEAAFTQQIDVAAAQARHDVERLEALLAADDEILRLRQRITAQAARQFDQGVITATDYLLERHAEHQAQLTRALHRLQLLQAHAHYRTTIGTP